MISGKPYNVYLDGKHLGTTTKENQFTFLSQAVIDGKIGPSFDYTMVQFVPVKEPPKTENKTP